MSTLKVTTIQDTAGANSSTTSAIANGIAKAWVNFNGTGVIAIRASFNVTSITDAGAGIYGVNFTTALVDANYSVSGLARDDSGGFFLTSQTLASTGVTVAAVRVSPLGNVDSGIVSVAIFR